MAISPYFARLRERIGHDLLLIPTVAVLPIDDARRVLLVRHVHSGQWATIGGAIEPDEAPAEAAVREAREEAGVELELTGLVTALGGPDYRLRYPNGDECACVVSVYSARVVGGRAAPDFDETSEVGWFGAEEIARVDVGELNRALLATVLPLLS